MPESVVCRSTPAGAGTLVAPTRMRSAIARQMATSKREIPHFYVSTEIQMDSVLAVIGSLPRPETGAQRVSVTACIIHELAHTLVEFPAFNSVWTEDGFVLVDTVNIGVAIALDEGLIAPALLNCQNLDLPETGAALVDLVARARTGRIRAAEFASATFTISNLGIYDVSSFSAIVIPPQVAILATGRASRRAVVESESIVIRSVMTATLSSDHRAVDGAQAARFLAAFKARLENPGN